MIAAAAIVSFSLPAAAQIPSSELPGRARERFEDQLPATRVQPAGTIVTLPSTVAPPGADKIRIHLRGVGVVGSTVYSTEQLQAIYQDKVGHEVTLAAIYDIAQAITARYGQDGYVLSRAVVPPQELNPSGAFVRIEIVEGYVDKVEWPKVLDKYRNFFAYYEGRIIAERPVNIRTIERYLLLASDLPGLKFKNSLKPSANKPGAATLVVEVTEKPIDAMARMDNRGTKPRGPWEDYSSVTVNNLMRMHDALTVNYASAFQVRELQYVGANWRQVLTAEGLTAFVNGSYSWGLPGPPVAPVLHYLTRSALTEFGLSYPFIRSREKNLTVSGLGFVTDDQSDILSFPLVRDRLRGMRLRIDGELADEARGINQLNVTISHGIDGLGSTSNDNLLASRFGGRVDFTKLEVTATRVQQLYSNLSVLVAAYGQYAFTPLLSSELCGYGGRTFGRGYDPSELVADSCLLLLGELRADLPITGKELTQAQLYLFADQGHLYNHNDASLFASHFQVDAASVGGGFRVGWLSTVNADLSVAKAIDGPRDDWRFFLILSGRY
jgi:hemolysin activation/secretion protein